MEGRNFGESLTNRQVTALAACVSAEKMRRIAVTYMGFTEEQTETLSTESEYDEETFKRNVIIRWANKSSEAQVKVHFFTIILFLLIFCSFILNYASLLCKLVKTSQQ